MWTTLLHQLRKEDLECLQDSFSSLEKYFSCCLILLEPFLPGTTLAYWSQRSENTENALGTGKVKGSWHLQNVLWIIHTQLQTRYGRWHVLAITGRSFVRASPFSCIQTLRLRLPSGRSFVLFLSLLADWGSCFLWEAFVRHDWRDKGEVQC